MGIVESYHCGKCNSQRKGTTCWKCGADTFTPDSSWEYPKLPPVDLIRQYAKEVGYAIGEHGSKERDLDLIAVPWSSNADSPEKLIQHLCEKLDAAQVGEIESKPLGRIAVSIQMRGWYRHIDLSITPIVLGEPNAI